MVHSDDERPVENRNWIGPATARAHACAPCPAGRYLVSLSNLHQWPRFLAEIAFRSLSLSLSTATRLTSTRNRLSRRSTAEEYATVNKRSKTDSVRDKTGAERVLKLETRKRRPREKIVQLVFGRNFGKCVSREFDRRRKHRASGFFRETIER